MWPTVVAVRARCQTPGGHALHVLGWFPAIGHGFLICPLDSKHAVQLLMMTDTITRCAWVARKLDIATSGPCGILSQTMSDGCRTM